MISRVGLAVSRVFQRCVPDPFVIAIFLTLLTALLALLAGDFKAQPDASRLVTLLDAWRADSGLWKFLAFGMQMCLILVTGHALASSRPVRSVIDALAGLPRNTAQAAGLVAAVACFAALINWGLGLIVGALLAREVGRALATRGQRAHYPLICAAGYMGLLVWHGGLSGSAPLSMTTIEGAAKVLPQAYVDQLGDAGIPLRETLFSGMNLVVTAGLVIGVPILLMLMAPTDPQSMRTIDDFDPPKPPADDPGNASTPGLPDRLETSPVVVWLIAVPLLLAVARYAQVTGLGRVGLNQVNAVMLALGLILHGSARAYMNAVIEGARGCAGIIVQFPLYAGIMAMMAVSGLVGQMARGFVGVGNDTTIPLLTFLSAGVVNLLVPSGGGQWGIQGPIALQTGLAAGIPPGKMIMAVAYGDQLTNMLQPFWALPLLGITGCKARDIVGYTAVVMVFAGMWMALGLLVL